jgi:hypothetical protein
LRRLSFCQKDLDFPKEISYSIRVLSDELFDKSGIDRHCRGCGVILRLGKRREHFPRTPASQTLGGGERFPDIAFGA